MKFSMTKKYYLSILLLSASLLCACNRYVRYDSVDLIPVRWTKSIPMNDMEKQTIYPAPGFTLRDIKNQEVSLSDFRGKWVILYFWGIWSDWCLKEMVILKNSYFKDSGKYTLICIDCHDTRERWASTVEKINAPGIQLYCPEKAKLTKIYGVEAYPSKYIIDPFGNIVYGATGYGCDYLDVLNDYIEEK